MNDLVIENVVVIPTVLRHTVVAVSQRPTGLELGSGLEPLESGVLVPGALWTPAIVQRVPRWGPLTHPCSPILCLCTV